MKPEYVIPGTRCAAIMTLIDAGFTDQQIADKFGTGRRTISVYRKAHDGTLAKLSIRKPDRNTNLGSMILRLLETGLTNKEIADRLNCDTKSVRMWKKRKARRADG